MLIGTELQWPKQVTGNFEMSDTQSDKLDRKPTIRIPDLSGIACIHKIFHQSDFSKWATKSLRSTQPAQSIVAALIELGFLWPEIFVLSGPAQKEAKPRPFTDRTRARE